ncbi:Gmad2 immunoglobulin-like domain-containing protein [Rossellomorea vietnamensis]|uniref:Gmad2 immunoglobulin-like domain-containing protein n=1 Tax=Rossellomorea vietnamensis TaxID=218284 RepID=UPI000761972D|nr:Gmad2 immunoglobulin-like domain-containing protein [Rossellomorea vietnamensis]
MKKRVFRLTVFTAVGLAACTPQQEGKEKPPVTEQREDSDSNKEDKNTPTVYQNESFKEVVVTQSEGEVMVTGKAQVFEGVFQYVLYDGGKVLEENNYQTAGAPAWGEFTLSFKKEIVTTNDIKLELFFYSAKDGSKTNVLEIPISKP